LEKRIHVQQNPTSDSRYTVQKAIRDGRPTGIPSSAQGSQQSTVEDVEMDASTDASSSPASSYEPTKRAPDKTQADLELIAAYLVKERAPDPVMMYSGRLAQFALAEYLLYTSK
jgi:hypothetical protein